MATNPAMTSKGSKNRNSGKSTRSWPIYRPRGVAQAAANDHGVPIDAGILP